METIEGFEMWVHDCGDLFTMVLTRAPNGMYSGWSKFLNAGARANALTPDEIMAYMTGDNVEWADLTTFVHRDLEFRSHRAAAKYGKKTLSRVMVAAQTPDGWEPGPGWRRLYDGDLTLQAFEANAAKARAAAKILAIEESLAKSAKIAPGQMTDQQYADHRRKVIELKMERAKLQGGNNA